MHRDSWFLRVLGEAIFVDHVLLDRTDICKHLHIAHINRYIRCVNTVTAS